MTHVYTRERHENKNTRFWATYGFNSVSAARHASSRVNATDLKFEIATLGLEELKSN